MISPSTLRRQKILKGATITYRYSGPGPYTTRPLDCARYNAVAVRISPPEGNSIAADVHIQGGHTPGTLLDLHDPNAVTLALASAKIIDCVVGTHYVAVTLENLTGTITPDQAWSISVTPYYAPGQSRVVASVG